MNRGEILTDQPPSFPPVSKFHDFSNWTKMNNHKYIAKSVAFHSNKLPELITSIPQQQNTAHSCDSVVAHLGVAIAACKSVLPLR